MTRRDRDDPTGKAPLAQVLPVSPCLSLPETVLGLWAICHQDCRESASSLCGPLAAGPGAAALCPVCTWTEAAPSQPAARGRGPLSSQKSRRTTRGSSPLLLWEGRWGPPGVGCVPADSTPPVHRISDVFQDFPSNRVSRGLGGLAEAQMGLDRPLRPSLPQTGHSCSQSPPPEVQAHVPAACPG